MGTDQTKEEREGVGSKEVTPITYFEAILTPSFLVAYLNH